MEIDLRQLEIFWSTKNISRPITTSRNRELVPWRGGGVSSQATRPQQPKTEEKYMILQTNSMLKRRVCSPHKSLWGNRLDRT